MECKCKSVEQRGIHRIELIDTLWNVNIFIDVKFSTNKRINRYIMECKLISFLVIFPGSPRINRYIMECKYHKWKSSEMRKGELIDTLWNVNIVGNPTVTVTSVN